jgi:8-oxo-dGTP diphosphatase
MDWPISAVSSAVSATSASITGDRRAAQHLVQHAVQPGDAAADAAAVQLKGQDGVVPGDLGRWSFGGFPDGAGSGISRLYSQRNRPSKGVPMIRRYGEPFRKPGQRYRRRPGVYASCCRATASWRPIRPRRCRSSSCPAAASTRANSRCPPCTAKCSRKPAGRSRSRRRIGAFRRFTYMPEYDLWAEKLCTVYLARPDAAAGSAVASPGIPRSGCRRRGAGSSGQCRRPGDAGSGRGRAR